MAQCAAELVYVLSASGSDFFITAELVSGCQTWPSACYIGAGFLGHNLFLGNAQHLLVVGSVTKRRTGLDTSPGKSIGLGDVEKRAYVCLSDRTLSLCGTRQVTTAQTAAPGPPPQSKASCGILLLRIRRSSEQACAASMRWHSSAPRAPRSSAAHPVGRA